jgi:tRNA(Arg) A34 adenosine deaminase TadA
MDEQERTARAREAKRILEHEVFQEALAKSRADILAKFAASEPGAVDEWRSIHAELQALKRVEGALKSYRTDGDKAVSTHARRVQG